MLGMRVGTRGRSRSGDVEADKLFDLGRVEEEAIVRRSPMRAELARESAFHKDIRVLCPSSTKENSMDPKLIVAAIDVHKRMLAVVVVDEDNPKQALAKRTFGSGAGELKHLLAWLIAHGVTQVVMESTAQYWRPVWLALEKDFDLHLAQAQSNAGPRGRKLDYVDALRLARRFLAAELRLSFVPDSEQRSWRCLSRSKYQKRRRRVQLQNQIEALLEETQIKLSSVLTDLLGGTGYRILKALAKGESDPQELIKLAANNLKASPEQLADSLHGPMQDRHRKVLTMQLEELDLIDKHIAELNQQLQEALLEHQQAVLRLCEMPGLKQDAALQIIAEIGPRAAVFQTPEGLASWIGVCPGREESAGESKSNRSPKGNRAMRRLLNQIAWGAVRTKDSFFSELYHRLVYKLGVHKAIWAVAHRIAKVIWKVLHEQVQYIERGPRALDPIAMKKRVTRLSQQMRKLGYILEVKPLVVETN
jgi:transposase